MKTRKTADRQLTEAEIVIGCKVTLSAGYRSELLRSGLYNPRHDLLIGTVKRFVTPTVYEVDFSPIGTRDRWLHRENLSRIGHGVGL